MNPDEINTLANAIIARLDLPSKDEILEAITNGVADAVVVRPDLPSKDEILETISNGVSLTAKSEDIIRAITNGITNAMPWEADILNTIDSAIRNSIRSLS